MSRETDNPQPLGLAFNMLKGSISKMENALLSKDIHYQDTCIFQYQNQIKEFEKAAYYDNIDSKESGIYKIDSHLYRKGYRGLIQYGNQMVSKLVKAIEQKRRAYETRKLSTPEAGKARGCTKTTED